MSILHKAPTVVLTSGIFDCLHRGHLNLLWMSKKLGDLLVVGIIMDGSFKDVVISQALIDRFDAVRRLSFVDLTVFQRSKDPTDLLERFNPDIYTHGGEIPRSHRSILERFEVEYVSFPYEDIPHLRQHPHEAVR